MHDAFIAVQVRKEDKELLAKVCSARGEQISDFVRRAIRKELASLGYCSPEEKKALGLED